MAKKTKKDFPHITKAQVDSTIASGIKNAFMTNKGVRYRMKQTIAAVDRKRQIMENKARQNEKALNKAYESIQADAAKKKTETAFEDFEAAVSQYSSDMGNTVAAPETFPVIDSLSEIEYAHSV